VQVRVCWLASGYVVFVKDDLCLKCSKFLVSELTNEKFPIVSFAGLKMQKAQPGVQAQVPPKKKKNL
jgi:hypothetical protein